MIKKLKKPQLTEAQIKEIQWLKEPKKKNEIKVGRFEQYWVLSKNVVDSPILVYDQSEWDNFVAGVKDNVFDDLANERR